MNSIDYLKGNEKITNRQYRELFKVSHQTAYFELKQLVDYGVIEQIGMGRGVYYKLLDD